MITVEDEPQRDRSERRDARWDGRHHSQHYDNHHDDYQQEERFEYQTTTEFTSTGKVTRTREV